MSLFLSVPLSLPFSLILSLFSPLSTLFAYTVQGWLSALKEVGFESTCVLPDYDLPIYGVVLPRKPTKKTILPNKTWCILYYCDYTTTIHSFLFF
jgi:hypothetical protein